MKIKNQNGFSMIEMILSIVISGIILGVTVQVMRTHIDAYSFITNRDTALSDASYALNRMAYELLRVDTADILTIAEDSIEFTDDDGNAASFETGPSGDDDGLFRGDELLLTPVDSLLITYYDINSVETAVIADIRKIELTLITAPLGTEGSITLKTMVTPRAFIYENYN